jgi:hypothetical protein
MSAMTQASGKNDGFDALDAFRTFRAAKNVFFVIMFLTLLMVQFGFWVVDLGGIDRMLPPRGANSAISDMRLRLTAGDVDVNSPPAPTPAAESAKAPEPTPEPNAAPRAWAKACAAEPVDAESRLARVSEWCYALVNVGLPSADYVLVFSAAFYCLSLLAGLNIALVGRLGGLADLSQAFFLSLLVLVLLVPWQFAVNLGVPGALFGYSELAAAYSQKARGVEAIWYYGRFTGLWAVTFLLLLAAQWRTHRASRKIRARLFRESKNAWTGSTTKPLEDTPI